MQIDGSLDAVPRAGSPLNLQQKAIGRWRQDELRPLIAAPNRVPHHDHRAINSTEGQSPAIRRELDRRWKKGLTRDFLRQSPIRRAPDLHGTSE